MATYFETGHAKNVANFEDLISFCIGYGAIYNPSQVGIKVANQQTLLTTAQAAIANVTNKHTAFKNATNAREIAFEPVKKLLTRVVNALDACGAKQQSVDDVNFYLRKIRGKAPKAKASAELGRQSTIANASGDNSGNINDENSIQHSTSQQSFDSIIDHFANLIAALSAEPLYAPNENELKVANLQTLLADLKTKNTAVINTYTAYSNARIDRNKTLYLQSSGLVDIAQEVKKYIKSIFGATGPQYKQVSGLIFRKIKV